MPGSHHDTKSVCVKENFASSELATNSSLINSLTFTFYSNTWIFLTPGGTGKQFDFKSIKQIFRKHLQGLDSSYLRKKKKLNYQTAWKVACHERSPHMLISTHITGQASLSTASLTENNTASQHLPV